MKRFLTYFGLIYLIIIGGFVVLEYVMKDVINEYSYKYRYLNNHLDDISYLILGNSHTGGAVNPHLLDSAFNMAQSARTLYYDAKISEEYIPRMHNLRVVILSHSYTFPWGDLSPNFPNNNDSWKNTRVFEYNKFMNIPYEQSKYKYIQKSALCTGHMYCEYFKQTKPGLDSYDSLGFYYRRKDIHFDTEWKVTCLPPNDLGIGSDSLLSYVQEYTKLLKRIAKVCYDNDVRCVAITTPCYTSYLEETKNIGIQTLYDIIESVNMYYPIEYYNYIDDEQFRADSLFYDCSHLNYMGAELLTKRLIKDLHIE